MDRLSPVDAKRIAGFVSPSVDTRTAGRDGRAVFDMTADPTETDGTLEWIGRPDKRTMWTAKSGPWTYTPYPGGGGWLRHGPSAVKFCKSEVAAKSLAQKLQTVLDGTSESRECPTNHTSMHLTPDPNTGPNLMPWSEFYDFCPDCGIRLGEETK